ncbi:MAG: carbohydrate kinase [Bacteroidales bacterium]|nr:carbohydrate kinase [Bacteroidales bacterium]
MKKIVAIGEVVWDVLPSGRKLGGAPVNFAYFAAQLGVEAFPITAVGRDELGDETLEALEATGLDLSLLQRNALPTSRVLVTLDAAGVPQYEIVENVAWDAMECTPAALDLLSHADAVCWGSLSQRSAASKAAVLQMLDAVPAGAVKVFDINIRQHYYDRDTLSESLRRADILKLNEDELPLLRSLFALPESDTGAIAELIGRFALQQVILTRGADCSEVYGPEGLLSHLDTPKVQVADTVGAGDSFTAAYVASRLQGRPVAEAHALAVRISAWVCTQAGAINPLPQDFLQ